MENPIRMDDLGVPLFLETSILIPQGKMKHIHIGGFLRLRMHYSDLLIFTASKNIAKPEQLLLFEKEPTQ